MSVPQSETSFAKLSHIDEYISSSPTYQTVPDFQRVQITGDYASGVSCSLPIKVATWCLFQLLTFLPFLWQIKSACLSLVILHDYTPIPIGCDLYFCFAFIIPRNFSSFISFAYTWRTCCRTRCMYYRRQWTDFSKRTKESSRWSMPPRCHRTGKGASRRYGELLGKDGLRADLQ